MQIIEITLVIILFSLIALTVYFWREQNKLLKKSFIHKNRKTPKFDMIEVYEDEQYTDYYEPKIIEVVSSEEVL